jgi:hypothetical protein
VHEQGATLECRTSRKAYSEGPVFDPLAFNIDAPKWRLLWTARAFVRGNGGILGFRATAQLVVSADTTAVGTSTANCAARVLGRYGVTAVQKVAE